MTEVASAERRLVVRILELWERLRGARPFPSVSDVESADFGPDWASCFVIAIGPDTGKWSFRHVGDDLLIPEWDGAIGGALADCPENTLLRHACGYLSDVLDKRVPISLGGDFQAEASRMVYRSIMLPLSEDGMRVDSVLGAANCRRLAAAGDPAARSQAEQA